ncbi:hypothetical protein ACFYNO_34065 [Kitasatospora sp. NPDC006697]|uniref:hypothetical protein n=1 Tax=Kitasatospora sp. NPDC006697 TaxID=3364020 RepID=UPI003692EA18
MDVSGVSELRAALAGSPLLDATRSFAGALRGAVTRRTARGLLLVGPAAHEPWHLAAHLADEAAWSEVPQLAPSLIRHQPDRPGGLDRLSAARRGETVLVVTPEASGGALLERVADARRGGAVVLALEAGDPELAALAHDRLTVEDQDGPGFELVQHLVSAAAGERARARTRLARLVRQLSVEPAKRW